MEWAMGISFGVAADQRRGQFKSWDLIIIVRKLIQTQCCGVSLEFGRAMGNDEPVTPVYPNSDYSWVHSHNLLYDLPSNYGSMSVLVWRVQLASCKL